MAARESFLDFRGKLRPDVRALKALMPVATAPFKVVLGAVCTYLEHPERFGASSHAQLLAAAAPLDAPAVQRLFTGLLLVVRAGLRSRHKPAEMQQDLEAELKMPAELAVLVAAAVQSRRAPLESAALERRPRCAALRDVDWRVEVTISTGSLARVLQVGFFFFASFAS